MPLYCCVFLPALLSPSCWHFRLQKSNALPSNHGTPKQSSDTLSSANLKSLPKAGCSDEKERFAKEPREEICEQSP